MTKKKKNDRHLPVTLKSTVILAEMKADFVVISNVFARAINAGNLCK